MNKNIIIDEKNKTAEKNIKKSNKVNDDLSNDDSITIRDVIPKVKLNKGLIEYIYSKKCNYGDKTFTHTWWDNKNNIIFKIQDDEYEDFLETYMRECNKSFGKLHVMEKPKDNGPLCLDFDIKQKNSDSKIKIDEIINVVESINSCIIKNFKLNNPEQQLKSYVLMKKKPFYIKDKDQYSDGFHIQYPNLILSTLDRYLIYDQSKKDIVKKDYFAEVYADEIKNEKIDTIYNSIFDKSVIKANSWFMYGSGKKYDGLVNLYELKYVFNKNVEEEENKMTHEELVKLLAIRKFNTKNVEYSSKKSTQQLIEEIKNKYMKYDYKNNVDEYFIKNAENDNDIENKLNTKISKLLTSDYNVNKNEENFIMAKKLIKLISKERAGPYNEWILIGWALYNISVNLLPEFIEFSKQNPQKYKDGCCEKVWSDCVKSSRQGGYSIASLYRWAREDNPTGYQELIREKVNKILEEGDIKTDFDIACILKEIYKYDYVCSSISKDVWWEFSNHRWKKVDKAYTLSVKMSTEVAKEFAKLSASYIIQSSNESGQKSDFYLKKSNDINKLITDFKKKKL